MQREERQLESSIDALIQRVQDVKASIAAFIFKLETEYQTLNWPSVLDSFALLSGQINSLNRLLKNEKTPLFHNQVCLPLVLSPDRDVQLEKTTEGRVMAFNHEVVPDYLRTKPDADAEEKITHLHTRGNMMTAENVTKQIAMLNKVCSNTLDVINNVREDWEGEINTKYQTPQTCTMEDTSALIAATSFGKGLKRQRPDMMPQPPPPQQQQPTQQRPPNPGQMPPQQMQPVQNPQQPGYQQNQYPMHQYYGQPQPGQQPQMQQQPGQPPMMQPGQPGGVGVQQAQMQPGQHQMMTPQQQMMQGGPGKMQSNIKTNIKVQPHPYMR